MAGCSSTQLRVFLSGRQLAARAAAPQPQERLSSSALKKCSVDQVAQVANHPIYVALAVTCEGIREILGLWAGDGGEGAKYWMHVLTEIKNRGVADVRMLVCDRGRLPRAVRRVRGGLGPEVPGGHQAVEAAWASVGRPSRRPAEC